MSKILLNITEKSETVIKSAKTGYKLKIFAKISKKNINKAGYIREYTKEDLPFLAFFNASSTIDIVLRKCKKDTKEIKIRIFLKEKDMLYNLSYTFGFASTKIIKTRKDNKRLKQ